MATKHLNASGYTGLSGMSTSSSYPVTNAYKDTDDTSDYARFSISTSTTGLVYFTFDCSDIPSNANNISITGKARLRISSTSRVTNRTCQIYTGTTAKGSSVSWSSTSSGGSVIDLSPGSSWTRSELDDLRVKIGGTGSSSSSSKYIYVYGLELDITYVTEARTVTTTLTGSGTISPSGSSTVYDDDEFVLTITPNNTSDTVTATKDGIDITSQLVGHGAGDTINAVPAEVTTSGIQSGSSYAEYAVGHSAESPSSSGTSSNMYSSSGSTGYAEYSFDFSDIPSGATIEDVSVSVYGHRESSTTDSSHVSNVQLYSGSTAKGDDVDFTSTSNQTITIDNPGTWTQSELQSAKLRHTVGYYGGLVLGITWTVTYSTGGGITHYTYTYTVSGNSTIAVVIGGAAETPTLYVKVNGTWVEVEKAYIKVNGAWVEQSDVTSVFQSGVNYKQG